MNIFFLLLEHSKAIIYKTLKYIFFIFNLKTYYMLKYSRLEILKLLFNIQIKKKKKKRVCVGVVNIQIIQEIRWHVRA